MNGSFWSEETYHQLHWLYCIVLLAGCIVIWIVSYCLDRIVSYHIVSYRILSYCIVSSGSYCIVLIVSYCIISDGSEHWLLCAVWLLPGWDGWYRWTGWGVGGPGWDGPTLAPARTGAPPWAPEQERHRWLLRGGGIWGLVAGTNCVGAARTRIICVGEAK